MEREQKRAEVTRLHNRFIMAKSVVILGFTGLTVDKDSAFRKQIRDVNANYKVSKNTILRLAVKDTAFSDLCDCFNGVNAIVTTECDSIGMFRVIYNFLKDNPKVVFKNAMIDGQLISFDEFKLIAESPAFEVLISRLLYLMKLPIMRLVCVLDAIRKQKEQK